jgi:hypothetical protein
MNAPSFVLPLLAIAIPIALVLLAASRLGHRGIGRVRLVDRSGRVLAEVVIGRSWDDS